MDNRVAKESLDKFLDWADICYNPIIDFSFDEEFDNDVRELAPDIEKGYLGSDIYKTNDELFYINYDIDDQKEIGYSVLTNASMIVKMFVLDINFFYNNKNKDALRCIKSTVKYH